MKKILLVGGYGTVGKFILERLIKNFDVIIVGRNNSKINSLCELYPQKLTGLKLDINSDLIPKEVLESVSLVINCIDLSNIKVIEECFKQKVDYIDISATYDVIQQIEKLNSIAQLSQAKAVLSVGIAPGLTNLLAAYCKSKATKPLEKVNLSVLLGLGEAHGVAAINWTLETIASKYTIDLDGKQQEIKSFTRKITTNFPEQLGLRKAYAFNFPEQYVVRKTLGYKEATSWLCFDDKLSTDLTALLASLGIFTFIKGKIKDLLVKLFTLIHVGSEVFAVQADSYDKQEELCFSATLMGFQEARITGLVAAKVAEMVVSGSYPYGVHHIEQLFTLDDFLPELLENGVKFYSTK